MTDIGGIFDIVGQIPLFLVALIGLVLEYVAEHAVLSALEPVASSVGTVKAIFLVLYVVTGIAFIAGVVDLVGKVRS